MAWEVPRDVKKSLAEAEFVFNKEEKRIDIRSASRVGYSDFGVNRNRLEKLRDYLRKSGIIQ